MIRENKSNLLKFALSLCCIISIFGVAFDANAQDSGLESSFAKCQHLNGILKSTLPVDVEMRDGALISISDGPLKEGAITALIGKQKQAYLDSYITKDSQSDQRANYQVAENDLRETIWDSHELSNNFWTREYFPIGAAPDINEDQVSDQKRLLKFAGEVLSALDKAPKDTSYECASLRAALGEAAQGALTGALRRLQATPFAVEGLKLGMDLLKNAASDCSSARACMLAARIATVNAENQSVSNDLRADNRLSALMMARKGVDLASKMGPSLMLAEAWMTLAEIEASSGDGDLAQKPLNLALETLNSLDMATRNPQDLVLAAKLPNQFRYRQLPIYRHGADLIYNDNKADKKSLKEKLIAFGETVRRAQIESVLADACEPLESPLSPQLLRGDETLVYPIIGAKRFYLLFGKSTKRDNSGWDLIERELDTNNTIGRSADRLLTFLQFGTNEYVRRSNLTYDNLPPPPPYWGQKEAQELHASLIAPLIDKGVISSEINSAFDKVDTVIFVPDPALRNVPWALLHKKPENQAKNETESVDFLVKSVAIAVTPALAYVDVSAKDSPRGGLLAAGLNEGHIGLLLNDLEVRKFSGFNPKVIRGDNFAIKSNLTDTLATSDYPVILFATHAQFSGSNSGILLAGGSRSEVLSANELETSLRSNRRRARRIELIILVSCEGGTGDAGELGLAGFALRGGARTTIGAVVKVSDADAPSYFSRDGNTDKSGNIPPSPDTFLSSYYRGRSPAQALRFAQLLPQEANNYPASWGSFLLLGNWR